MSLYHPYTNKQKHAVLTHLIQVAIRDYAMPVKEKEVILRWLREQSNKEE